MIKHLALLGCLCVTGIAIAGPTSCPSLKEIQRVSGEYAWETQNALFEGYFASPTFGRGQSSQVIQFLGAKWMQLTNLNQSTGMIECDYAGNVPGEIIRFVLINSQVNPKPEPDYWNCAFTPPFPSQQCTCTNDTDKCSFKTS